MKQLKRGALSKFVAKILPDYRNESGVIDFDGIWERVKKIAGRDYPKPRVYPLVAGVIARQGGKEEQPAAEATRKKRVKAVAPPPDAAPTKRISRKKRGSSPMELLLTLERNLQELAALVARLKEAVAQSATSEVAITELRQVLDKLSQGK